MDGPGKNRRVGVDCKDAKGKINAEKSHVMECSAAAAAYVQIGQSVHFSKSSSSPSRQLTWKSIQMAVLLARINLGPRSYRRGAHGSDIKAKTPVETGVLQIIR
jgi:hypothetical protein